MNWNQTKDVLPPESQVVDTLSEGGTQQTLKRVGNLWFFPDGSMYVYYTPKYWAELPEDHPEAQSR